MHHKSSIWSVLITLVYFALMSVLVPFASSHGMGADGIFYAMAGSALAIALPVGGIWYLRRRLARQGIGARAFGGFLMGGPVPPIVESDLLPRALPVPARMSARFASRDDEEEWDEEDDLYEEEDEEEWDEEDEEDELDPDVMDERFAARAHHRRSTSRRWQPDELEDEEDEVDLLDLAPTLRVHPDTMLSGRVLVAGMPGSGKTNTVRHMLEESAQLGLPFLVIDLDGEYWTLLPHLLPEQGTIAGRFNRTGVREDQFAEVPREADGFAFGKHLMEQHWQVVFDVPSYTDPDGEVDENTAALIFMEIVRGMRSWAESRPIDERIPSVVLLEEAQIWLPQQFTGSTLADETLRKLRKVFTRSSRDGRRRGVGLILVAHRLAGILKDVCLCDWTILHAPMRTDLRRYRELAPNVPKERFLRLSKGRAVVISPLGTQEVHFHQAQSRDQGHSPDLAALRRHHVQPRRPVPPSSSVPPASKAHDTIPLPQTLEEGRAMPAQPSSFYSQPTERMPAARPLSPRLQQALIAWQGGANSRLKLAAALGIGENAARSLIDKLDTMGLIRKNRKEQDQ